MRLFLFLFTFFLSSCSSLNIWKGVPVLKTSEELKIKGESVFFRLNEMDTLINGIAFHRFYYFDDKDTIITRFGIKNDTVYIFPYIDVYSDYNLFYPFFYLPGEKTKIPEKYTIEINTSSESLKREIICFSQISNVKDVVKFQMSLISHSSHPTCDYFIFQVSRENGIIKFDHVSPDEVVWDFIPFSLKGR